MGLRRAAPDARWFRTAMNSNLLHPPMARSLQPARSGLPPGPALSEREQAFAWFSRPCALLDDCSAQFGDRFVLRVAGWGLPAVVVSDPEAIRDIFTAPPEDMRAGSANAYFGPLFGRHSLLLLDGDAHLRERKLLLPAFHGGRLAAYGRAIQQITRHAAATWPDDMPFAVLEELLGISLEVILRVVFGLNAGEDRYVQVRDAVTSVLGAITTSIAWAGSATGGTRAAFGCVCAELDQLIASECAQRRASPAEPRSDVLQLLVEARNADGSPLADGQLRDELLTMLLTGHETAATTLAWALVLLSQHSDVQTRLRSTLDDLGPAPEPAVLDRHPYLRAVVEEVLRIHPVVPVVSRVLARPRHVGGLALEAGTVVSPCIYLAHRRAATFPDPECFRPDRFIGATYSPYEYLPFGGGARRCVGMGLAVYEMRLVLAEILRSFTFELAGDTPHPVRRTAIVGPSGGARVIFHRRSRRNRDG